MAKVSAAPADENPEAARSEGRALREGAAVRNAMLAVALAKAGHVGGERRPADHPRRVVDDPPVPAVPGGVGHAVAPLLIQRPGRELCVAGRRRAAPGLGSARTSALDRARPWIAGSARSPSRKRAATPSSPEAASRRGAGTTFASGPNSVSLRNVHR